MKSPPFASVTYPFINDPAPAPINAPPIRLPIPAVATVNTIPPTMAAPLINHAAHLGKCPLGSTYITGLSPQYMYKFSPLIDKFVSSKILIISGLMNLHVSGS